MAFPTNLTNALDGVTDVVADHLNNLEAKVGIDGSLVTTSLDYLLKNPASVDPGHIHSGSGTISKATGVELATGTDDAKYATAKALKDASIIPTSGTNTGDENVTRIGALINGAAAKTTPVDADMIGLMNTQSTPANILYRVSWGNIKATLKSYFDTLYTLANLGGVPTSRQVNGHALSADVTVSKGDVGLGNCDNTADANKPVSTAQQAALDGKVPQSLATAANDFLVASGTGVFVKKTLAETKAVIGMASTSFTGPTQARTLTVPDADKTLMATDFSNIGSSVLPVANGGALQGTTVNSSGPVSVTTALARQTFVATDNVTYNLPTGDLSTYIGVTTPPLQFAFVNLGANGKALTINPGSGNFIANGAAAATFANTSTGMGIPTLTLRLVSSAALVNKWAIFGADEAWVPSS